MRILASKIRHIGDLVLWTSALESLKKSFPDAQVEVLVPSLGVDVLKHHPAVDRVHTVGEGSLELVKKLWALRKTRYDYFLGFHANTSLCRWARWVNAKEKILHHHSWKYSPAANTWPVPEAGTLEHAIRRDHRVLEAIGILGAAPLPRLYVSEEERAIARAKLGSRAGSQFKTFTALVPGARSTIRKYPEDLWKTFARQLRKRDRSKGIIVIADKEQSRSWHLDEFCGENQIALFSDQSLRDVIALLAECESAVGNDSGLTHVAAALGLKTLTIFGPGCYGDWAPADPSKNLVARIEVPCRAEGPRDQDTFQYCTIAACDHHSCLRKQSPESILRMV